MTVITLLPAGGAGLAWGTVTDFGAGERAPRVRDPSGEVLLTTEDRTNGPGDRLTRRGFLKAAGAGAAWITLTGTLGCEPTKRVSEKTPATTPSPAQPEPVLVQGSQPSPQ